MVDPMRRDPSCVVHYHHRFGLGPKFGTTLVKIRGTEQSRWKINFCGGSQERIYQHHQSLDCKVFDCHPGQRPSRCFLLILGLITQACIARILPPQTLLHSLRCHMNFALLMLAKIEHVLIWRC